MKIENFEIGAVLSWATNHLKQTSSSPALDAEVLLAFVLKKSRAYLIANQTNNLTTQQYNKFKGLIKKRARFWPVAYLVGHKEFFGLDFYVTPDVFIPRPESELLVERALEILQANSYKLQAVCDIGTGSGNLVIALAKTLQKFGRLAYQTPQLYGIDSSPRSLEVARRNARRHGVINRIKFLSGNLLSPLLQPTSYQLPATSLILANLPYLSTKQLNNLTIKHEPKQALSGGPDGLKYFKKIFKQLQKKSPPARGGEAAGGGEGVGEERPNLTLLLEHDPRQKPALAKLAKKFFPHALITFHRDLAGRFRVMEIKNNKKP